MSFVSYAQNFEDVILWRALSHVKNGAYVDVGAHHPEKDSVSKAFYDLGWRGVNVEPVAEMAQALREARPDEVVIEAAVSMSPKPISLAVFPGEGLSTGVEEIARRHKAAGYPSEKRTAETIRLSEVLEPYDSKDLHWLKIDIEGMEDEALESWGNCPARPWIVVVESTLPSLPIENDSNYQRHLTTRGYKDVYFDGLNRFFVHESVSDLAACFGPGPNVFDRFSLQAESPFVQNINRDYLERQESAAREFEKNLERSLLEQAARSQETLAERTGALSAELAEKVAYAEALASRMYEAIRARIVSETDLDEKSQQLKVSEAENASLAERIDQLHEELNSTVSEIESRLESETASREALESEVASREAEIASLTTLSRKELRRHKEALAALRAEQKLERNKHEEALAVLRAEQEAERNNHAEALAALSAEHEKQRNKIESDSQELIDKISRQLNHVKEELSVLRLREKELLLTFHRLNEEVESQVQARFDIEAAALEADRLAQIQINAAHAREAKSVRQAEQDGKKIELLEEELNNLNQYISSLRMRLEEREAQEGFLSAQVDELSNELKISQGALHERQLERDAHAARAGELSSEAEELRSELNEMERSAATFRVAADGRINELEEYSQVLTDRFNDEQLRGIELVKNNESLSKTLSNLRSEYAALKSGAVELEQGLRAQLQDEMSAARAAHDEASDLAFRCESALHEIAAQKYQISRLVGETDRAHVAEAQAHREIHNMSEALRAAEAEIAALRASTSWRLSSPVRFVGRFRRTMNSGVKDVLRPVLEISLRAVRRNRLLKYVVLNSIGLAPRLRERLLRFSEVRRPAGFSVRSVAEAVPASHAPDEALTGTQVPVADHQIDSHIYAKMDARTRIIFNRLSRSVW